MIASLGKIYRHRRTFAYRGLDSTEYTYVRTSGSKYVWSDWCKLLDFSRKMDCLSNGTIQSVWRLVVVEIFKFLNFVFFGKKWISSLSAQLVTHYTAIAKIMLILQTFASKWSKPLWVTHPDVIVPTVTFWFESPLPLEELIWAAATPLEVRFLPAWQVSWVSSTPWLSLSLVLSLSLSHSLTLSLSPVLSHSTTTFRHTHYLFVTFTDFVLLTGIAALHWLRLSISISISGAWSRHGGPLWQCQCWRSYHMDVQWSHWSHEERRDRHRDELSVWDSCS